MSVREIHIHCHSCSFKHLCLPESLDEQELTLLDDIVERKKPLQKGNIIVERYQPFKSLFAVRSGSFKSFITNAEGEEQITDFHYPGDIIGFDALHSKHYTSSSVALETAMVCELPFNQLNDLANQFPKLKDQIMRFMSEEIHREHEMIMMTNKRTAEERLLNFLFTLSKRFAARGLAADSFYLTMTRSDIGSYLGLTIETTSRLMTKFQKQGLIEVKGKLINILEPERLAQLALVCGRPGLPDCGSKLA